ncbi:hypothetical protein Leryth_001187 [Lithospermum erythrorhizon]|nr:hypothetical protein Leryth_001187 [Lithospermum erythrorhizon]
MWVVHFSKVFEKPGPKNVPMQCFIRRDKTSSINRLSSDKYMDIIRSNIFGTKFSMYDSQSRCKSAQESIGCFPENSTSEKLSSRYLVTVITYEFNLLRSRGPRRMLCTMDTIHVATIQEVY